MAQTLAQAALLSQNDLQRGVVECVKFKNKKARKTQNLNSESCGRWFSLER